MNLEILRTGRILLLAVDLGLPLLGAFLGVCVLKCVAGWWLWVGRRAGRSLSWALLPAELVFSIGFALPFGPALGATRTLLLVRRTAAGDAGRMSR